MSVFTCSYGQQYTIPVFTTLGPENWFPVRAVTGVGCGWVCCVKKKRVPYILS